MRMRNSFETNLPIEIYKGRQASTDTSRSQTKRHASVFRRALESKKSRLVSDKSETKDKPERSERVF